MRTPLLGALIGFGSCATVPPSAPGPAPVPGLATALETGSAWPRSPTPWLGACFVLGDFDGDGSDDVCLRLNASNARRIWTGNGPRDVTLAGFPGGEADDAAARTWLSGRAFDWNGDGRADLAFAQGGDVRMLTNVFDRDSPEQVLVHLAEGLPAGTWLVGSAGDWDRDGAPDLVLALPERGIVWCKNTGTATTPAFGQVMPIWPAVPGEIVTALHLQDRDGDGWLDLFIGSAHRADGSGDFTMLEPRTDLTPLELAEQERLQAQLTAHAQHERRVAAGLEPPSPVEQLVGSDFRGTPAHAVRDLTSALHRLQFREQPFVANAARWHARKR
ncbi:MAG TPA: VCBS repeat-containing protein [Planctomycetota bacterium]|nr:VCBS repeat-containing protein [Planctomycetota bacterium]